MLISNLVWIALDQKYNEQDQRSNNQAMIAWFTSTRDMILNVWLVPETCNK